MARLQQSKIILQVTMSATRVAKIFSR